MTVLSASSKALALNKLGHVKHWAVDSNDPSAGENSNMHFVDTGDPDANIVTSELKDGSGLHSVVLDIDLGAELVPSTTPGHFHLYIDKAMTWARYLELIDVMTDVGIIEPGYLSASEARGFTAVRLPWVKKETQPQPELPGQLAFSPEPRIPGTDLPESTVRRLLAHGLATDAERTWLANLDAANEAGGKDAWPTDEKDPF